MSSRIMPYDRDPIREQPLRDPGQSIRERIDDRFPEVCAPWIAVSVLAIIGSVVEWLRWYFVIPYAPVV